MELSACFELHPEAAIAFSGGVDSSFLLWAASKYARRFKAYYAASQFQPQFERDDALRLAKELGANMQVIELDVLSAPKVAENPNDRCYWCKKAIFAAISSAALADGFTVIMDGTNASDDAGDRPGMKALKELSVLSPLRDCGLTKAEIRRLSKEAGLFTWNKPAYACLATRIPAGQAITPEMLAATEESEDYLFSLGFTDFRVRTRGKGALLQMREEQLPLLLEHRTDILEKLGRLYQTVALDLEVRR